MKVFFLVILFAIANAKSIEDDAYVRDDDGKYSFRLQIVEFFSAFSSMLVLFLRPHWFCH